MMSRCGSSTGGEKIFQISSNTPLFFFLLLFDHRWSDYIWPPLPPTLWFGRFLRGFKGKLMLLQMHVVLFFNSWYLLVFLAFQT